MEGVTRDSLKRLLDLQRVDSTIDRLRQRAADLPEQRALDQLAAEHDEVAAARAAKRAELEEIARSQSRLDGEIAMLEEKIRHESDRLYGGDISNPKELASIQAELDALRRRKSHVEDQDLEVMERREAVEREVAALEERLADLARRVEEARAARDAAAVEIERELAESEAARASILPDIPPELLELYRDLRAKKDGVAAAALERGVCRGCGVALSPMALDAIRHAPEDEVARCENCRRILVPV
jgi:predicted  nucleic acid-binding Zn-ribbon protein